MDAPDIRYAKSGDVSIAYQVVGDGPQDLVVVRGSLAHLDSVWEPGSSCSTSAGWASRTASAAFRL